MSQSQHEIIKVVSRWIRDLVEVYKEELLECEVDTLEYKLIGAKIEALEELIVDINEPQTIVSPDWANKIQESLNIIETNKIIKDGL